MYSAAVRRGEGRARQSVVPLQDAEQVAAAGQEGPGGARLCFCHLAQGFQCTAGAGDCWAQNRSPRHALVANVLGNGTMLLQWGQAAAWLHALSCSGEGAYMRFPCDHVELLPDTHSGVRYHLCL